MSASSNTNTTPATIVYILYLTSLFIPFTALIGVITAYIYQKHLPEVLSSHYQFQIRTFWIGILYLLIGSALTLILVGWLLLIFYIIWLIIRCIRGLKYLHEQRPIPHPKSWLFG